MAGEAVPYLLGGAGLVCLAVMAYGAVLLRRGVAAERRRRAFLSLSPTATGALREGETAKLVGTAAPDGESGTVTGLFTGREALLVRHGVQEYRSQGADRGYDWETVHETTLGEQFRLVDEDGSVAVEAVPEALNFEEDRVATTVVDSGEDPPDPIAEYVAANGIEAVGRGFGTAGSVAGGRRRYRESAIRPGDAVTVHGRPRRDPEGDWGAGLVVAPDPAEGGLVTDRSGGSLAGVGRGAARLKLVVGAVLVVVPPVVAAGLFAAAGLI